MATYCIGDVQGCHDELRALLELIRFDARRDRLLFAGDLVNRGPRSADVLRLVMDLGERAVAVLGNHDLHLLAVACGARASAGPHDTFDDVLAATDAGELLAWLRQRPLAYREPETGVLLVHAGLLPQWSVADALSIAAELADAMRGDGMRSLLAASYRPPRVWNPTLPPLERHALALNCLTRLRYCSADGVPDFAPTGPPGTQPEGLLPWYAVPGRASAGHWIAFGHWSTLCVDPVTQRRHRIIPLDTGCVWGGRLTAVRLEDRAVFQVSSHTAVPIDGG